MANWKKIIYSIIITVANSALIIAPLCVISGVNHQKQLEQAKNKAVNNQEINFANALYEELASGLGTEQIGNEVAMNTPLIFQLQNGDIPNSQVEAQSFLTWIEPFLTNVTSNGQASFIVNNQKETTNFSDFQVKFVDENFQIVDTTNGQTSPVFGFSPNKNIKTLKTEIETNINKYVEKTFADSWSQKTPNPFGTEPLNIPVKGSVNVLKEISLFGAKTTGTLNTNVTIKQIQPAYQSGANVEYDVAVTVNSINDVTTPNFSWTISSSTTASEVSVNPAELLYKEIYGVYGESSTGKLTLPLTWTGGSITKSNMQQFWEQQILPRIFNKSDQDIQLSTINGTEKYPISSFSLVTSKNGFQISYSSGKITQTSPVFFFQANQGFSTIKDLVISEVQSQIQKQINGYIAQNFGQPNFSIQNFATSLSSVNLTNISVPVVGVFDQNNQNSLKNITVNFQILDSNFGQITNDTCKWSGKISLTSFQTSSESFAVSGQVNWSISLDNIFVNPNLAQLLMDKIQSEFNCSASGNQIKAVLPLEWLGGPITENNVVTFWQDYALPILAENGEIQLGNQKYPVQDFTFKIVNGGFNAVYIGSNGNSTITAESESYITFENNSELQNFQSSIESVVNTEIENQFENWQKTNTTVYDTFHLKPISDITVPFGDEKYNVNLSIANFNTNNTSSQIGWNANLIFNSVNQIKTIGGMSISGNGKLENLINPAQTLFSQIYNAFKSTTNGSGISIISVPIIWYATNETSGNTYSTAQAQQIINYIEGLFVNTQENSQGQKCVELFTSGTDNLYPFADFSVESQGNNFVIKYGSQSSEVFNFQNPPNEQTNGLSSTIQTYLQSEVKTFITNQYAQGNLKVGNSSPDLQKSVNIKLPISVRSSISQQNYKTNNVISISYKLASLTITQKSYNTFNYSTTVSVGSVDGSELSSPISFYFSGSFSLVNIIPPPAPSNFAQLFYNEIAYALGGTKSANEVGYLSIPFLWQINNETFEENTSDINSLFSFLESLMTNVKTSSNGTKEISFTQSNNTVYSIPLNEFTIVKTENNNFEIEDTKTNQFSTEFNFNDSQNDIQPVVNNIKSSIETWAQTLINSIYPDAQNPANPFVNGNNNSFPFKTQNQFLYAISPLGYKKTNILDLELNYGQFENQLEYSSGSVYVYNYSIPIAIKSVNNITNNTNTTVNISGSYTTQIRQSNSSLKNEYFIPYNAFGIRIYNGSSNTVNLTLLKQIGKKGIDKWNSVAQYMETGLRLYAQVGYGYQNTSNENMIASGTSLVLQGIAQTNTSGTPNGWPTPSYKGDGNLPLQTWPNTNSSSVTLDDLNNSHSLGQYTIGVGGSGNANTYNNYFSIEMLYNGAAGANNILVTDGNSIVIDINQTMKTWFDFTSLGIEVFYSLDTKYALPVIYNSGAYQGQFQNQVSITTLYPDTFNENNVNNPAYLQPWPETVN